MKTIVTGCPIKTIVTGCPTKTIVTGCHTKTIASWDVTQKLYLRVSNEKMAPECHAKAKVTGCHCHIKFVILYKTKLLSSRKR